MTYRQTFSLVLLLWAYTCYAQKIPYYATLDTLKKAPHSATYKDDRDSIRELAHDFADSLIEHADTRTHFELGLDFNTRQLISGRLGPAYNVIGSPSLKYQHKVGLYIALGLDVYRIKNRQVNISRHPVSIDTVSVDKVVADIIPSIGYSKTFFEKWDIDVSLEHTFMLYGKDPNYLATSVNISTGFDFWDYIKANVEYNLLLGGSSKTPSAEKKYSNILAFELCHDFKIYRFLGATIFTIQPMATVDVGNDNYVRGKLLSKDQDGGIVISKPLTDDFFGLLNVEGAVNIEYRIKNLSVELMPRVSIPFNVVPANATEATPFRNNKSTGAIFYFAATIKYNFRFWKEKK